ncbi:MAG: carbohydrate kinase [Deltaproteobacteria bacterium]|nr:carbohydrate kinase [Deltaproteobacteria bacterium]
MAKEWCFGAGFVALDIVRSINGRTTERRFAGGSCGNVLAILSYLGWKSAPIARIGDDQPGRELVKDLEHWSVDTRFLLRETTAQTPIVFQEIVFNGQGAARHRFSRICPKCGVHTANYRPWLQRDLNELVASIPSASLFYFDRVARANLEIATHARQNGALVVFEPSGIKDPGLFDECLHACHVFKYSHERLSSVQDAATDAEVPVEIETRGSAGLTVTIRQGRKTVHEEELPAVPAPRLKDAAGSGDWCSAGFVHALLSDRTRLLNLTRCQKAVVRALRWGQALAALNCSYEGARGLMYAMPRAGAVAVISDMLKGNDVSGHIETAVAKYRRSSRRAGTCIVCDRELKGQ